MAQALGVRDRALLWAGLWFLGVAVIGAAICAATVW